MADFLLVHGSCHGAWCWRDLIPALEHLGHSARAIDLPGNGADTTPLAQVTLEDTAKAIQRASRPSTIVMAHSWGGVPMTLAADQAPEFMAGLIYLCAYVPLPELSMIDMRKRAKRQPLAQAVIKDPQGVSYVVDTDQQRRIFYHDCTDETVRFAQAQLRPQAIRPQDTPVPLTGSWRSIPHHYILCEQDGAIPPEYQAEMVSDWPRSQVHSLPTSHSPFFSAPKQLAQMMDQISKDL
ncbi:MAG: alpha/beta fold hydrolase [Rhodobacteraceae bacterium]|nr:alpha/beta fold hydrolase [Paracoccaceae bacterium]